MQKSWKMIETLANRYSSDSTHRDLPNKYQHDMVEMVFKYYCFLVLWTKVALALEVEKDSPEHSQRSSKPVLLSPNRDSIYA